MTPWIVLVVVACLAFGAGFLVRGNNDSWFKRETRKL